MRGLAAAAVAVYHTQLILAQPEYGGISIFHSWASKGWLGVNFFFVLSGFIILFAHARDIGRPERTPSYIWKRVVRVYPVYWVALALYLLLAAFHMGHSNFSWAPVNIASAFLILPLTPGWTLPLQVAWTLAYEIHFYIAFAVLVFNRLAGLTLFAVWALSILIVNFGTGVHSADSGIFHVWNLYFLVGALTLLAFKSLPLRLGPWILAFGLVTLVPAAVFLAGERVNDAQWNPPALLALAFPFALILLGAALSERRFGWRIPNLDPCVRQPQGRVPCPVRGPVLRRRGDEHIGGGGLSPRCRTTDLASGALAVSKAGAHRDTECCSKMTRSERADGNF
jgi:exopolysaccharide production protein ExoZ